MKVVFRTLATFVLACTPAVSQTPASAKSPADAADFVKQARKLNSEGKQDEALSLYNQALQASPNSVDAHLGAGAALDLKGQYDEARKHFAKAIEVAPPENRNGALRNMAFSYAFERKAKDAARYEQMAFDSLMNQQKDTDAAGVANELARIYLESGDIDDAARWYKTGYDTAMRQPDLKDSDKDLWNFRWEHAQARFAARRNQKAEAQKHVAAAKAILDKGTNPDQSPFYPYLTGYVAFYGGDYSTAITELQKADQRDPFILVLLAQAYEKSGDKAQATEYYRKVLASNIHNPTNAFARPIARQKLGSS